MLASLALLSPATAATTAECSQRWAEMKKNDKVPQGMTWPKFLSQCSKDMVGSDEKPTARQYICVRMWSGLQPRQLSPYSGEDMSA